MRDLKIDYQTSLFEEHRRLLEGVAYRMLGSLSDAQDVVQETYLKWSTADHEAIRAPRAWLVTVCSRIAIDLMKSARVKRESYYGTWLPEPYVDEHVPDPSSQCAMDDTVSVALMVVLEKLTPLERAAFLLHDVFANSYAEIAEILGKPEATCRKLASRGRATVQAERSRFQASASEHHRLLDAFSDAAYRGDSKGLIALLASSVELHSDGGGKVAAVKNILVGSNEVSGFFAKIWGGIAASASYQECVSKCRYNGAPGLLVMEDGRLVTAISLSIADGLIHRIYAVRNPDKLAGLVVEV